uniref:Uncharacterized protein n=1 Tax=Glossina austeni TaxID=7395 RepID=A0A1A9UXD0_GLOAU
MFHCKHYKSYTIYNKYIIFNNKNECCKRPEDCSRLKIGSIVSPLLLTAAAALKAAPAAVLANFERSNCGGNNPVGLELVGEALALNSAGDIFTPALANKREANSGSKALGIGSTGKSLVEIPRCCRDICECKELRDFATVPHNTQR